MGITLFSVLSLDGCVSDSSGEAKWGINYKKLGIDKFFEDADREITVPLPVPEIKVSSFDTSFIIEATDRNIAYIAELMNADVIDEIVFLFMPYIAGSGKQLLSRCHLSSYWELVELLPLEAGILFAKYRKMPFDGEHAV
ncbi:MAG: hypothetical protein E7087_07335 [Bacteroidales bacterium]|nr:hypothetical protein [Bacteroidales bacterium]